MEVFDVAFILFYPNTLRLLSPLIMVNLNSSDDCPKIEINIGKNGPKQS